jgi:4-amino-4-deoxy-L-arabinose transferase-like glycosyltransferase
MNQHFRSLQVIRLPSFFWFVTFVALALILLILPRSPLPWLDEIFYASSSLSVVRGGTPVPTIMGAFPHTSRLDLLYGPMIPYLGALEVKLFGLSATSWRLLSFLGGVAAVLSAAWVSRMLNRSQTAMAATAMMVALSQGMGARATSGRLDTVTITLELLSLACTLGAMRFQEPTGKTLVYAGLAGIFCGLAALSTPRAFPFVLGLFVAIALELALAGDRKLFGRALVVSTGALLTLWAWTLTQGMNPIGWLRVVAAASRGDKINVSPILHGSWHLFGGPMVPLLSGSLFILVMLLVFGGAITTARRAAEEKEHDVISGVRLASITVMINYVALFVMIARFWDYEIFVVPLVIPVVVALTAKMLLGSGSRILPRAIFGTWLILAILLVAVRSGKVVAWLVSYNERDPQPLQDFVSRNVPTNSRVFGPGEFYFYAVEAAGSHYLFAQPTIPPGLLSKLDLPLNWKEQLNQGQPVYLIWPKDEGLPGGLAPANLRLVGSFTAKLGNEPLRWRLAGWGAGYPPTNLYRVVDADSGNKPAAQ